MYRMMDYLTLNMPMQPAPISRNKTLPYCFFSAAVSLRDPAGRGHRIHCPPSTSTLPWSLSIKQIVPKTKTKTTTENYRTSEGHHLLSLLRTTPQRQPVPWFLIPNISFVLLKNLIWIVPFNRYSYVCLLQSNILFVSFIHFPCE